MTDQEAQLLAEGEKAYQDGQWETAAQIYEKVLRLSPDLTEACRRLAAVLALRGRLKATIVTLLHLWEVVEAHQDLPGMIEACDRLLELQPTSVELLAKKVEVLRRLGMNDQALELARELAPAALNQGHGDLALDILQKAFAIAPDNQELGIQLAETLLSEGQLQAAQNLYRKIAKTYLEKNDQERAAETFRRLSVLVSNDVGLHLILGDLYQNLGRYSEAETQYRSVLKVNLNHVEALLGLARVGQLKGQYRDAVLALTRILQTEPDELRAHERLGELYRMQSLVQESIKHYLLAALACVDCGAPRRAQQYFQTVLEMDPRNMVALRHLHELQGKA